MPRKHRWGTTVKTGRSFRRSGYKWYRELPRQVQIRLREWRRDDAS